MVYFFVIVCLLHVCPGEIFILNSRLAKCLGKKLPFWVSACCVLIVVPLI